MRELQNGTTVHAYFNFVNELFFFAFSTESASSEFTKWRKWKERPVRKRKQVTKDFSECFVTTYVLPRKLIFLAVFFSRARRRIATLLWHCFEWLQHFPNISTLCCAKNRRWESSRVTSPLETDRFTANVNFYHMTKFSLYLLVTGYYFYSKISGFTLFLSTRTVLNCFHPFFFSILRNSQLESDNCHERDSKSLYWHKMANSVWVALRHGEQHYKIVFADVRKWHN